MKIPTFRWSASGFGCSVSGAAEKRDRSPCDLDRTTASPNAHHAVWNQAGWRANFVSKGEHASL